MEEDLGNSLVPPGYEESKELQKIDTPQLNSLFTGMNVKDNGLDEPATDCKDTGVLSHVSASETICTLVDLVDTVPTEQISVNDCTDMSEEKIRQSSSVSVDKIPSNFQLLTFEAEGKYIDNNLTDETVNSFSNERDLLDLQSSCSNMVENGQNVTSQISENLLLMDSGDNSVLHNNSQTGENGPYFFKTSNFPPLNSNMPQLSQTSLRNTTYRGILPNTSSSFTGSGRLFPKDMKSETDGFDFVRKSKSDAFSFIQDEILASKPKTK